MRFCCPCRWAVARSRKNHRREAGETRTKDCGRTARLGRIGAGRRIWTLRCAPIRACARDRRESGRSRPAYESISVEDTVQEDVLLAVTEPMIRRLAEKLWSASRKESRTARTVLLKLKTSEFRILIRSHTPDSPPFFLQRTDGNRLKVARTSGSRSTSTLPACGCRSEQFSRSGRYRGTAGAFRVKAC